VDGAFLAPLRPELSRVHLPEREPRYVLRIDARPLAFVDGQTLVVSAGQALVLELAAEPVASAP